MAGKRGRQRSEQSIEAEKLYHEAKKSGSGITLADIAKHLQVPEATVRRWKSTQKWDDRTAADGKKKLTERSENEKTNGKEKPNVRKKGSGAPKGNKNAVGNKGGLKYGLCTRLLYQTLTDEEKQALEESGDPGTESRILEEIHLTDIRIAVLEGKKRELMTRDTKVSVVGQSRTEKTQEIDGEPTGVVEKTTTTSTENKDLAILKFDATISGYLARKNKLLDSLAHIHDEEARRAIEVQKIELEKMKLKQEEQSNKSVDDWMASFEEV